MTGGTHFLAGAAIGALVGQKAGSPFAGAALGGFAALLPDIDHPGSTVGRVVKPVSVILEAIGHRSVTHTIWFCLVVSSVLAALLGLSVAFFGILFLGSLSHVILDSFTRSGTRPLLPVPFHVWGPLVTGNILHEGVVSLLAMAVMLKVLAG